MKYILAIDQSTSRTKAALFNPAGQMLDIAWRDHTQHYPQPSWVEHNAEEIWQNTLAAIREVVSRHSQLPLCLSITNQRETFVVFDRVTGRPLLPAIVWQCRRGDEICQSLTAAGHDSLVRHSTGLKIDSYFTGSKLAWIVQHHPEIRQKLLTGEALWGTIDTYLIYRLTSGQVFATDHTNASRTLLFDARSLNWDASLCSLFGQSTNHLPQVRESSALFGETRIEGLLTRPIPICGVMGDSQASLFAQRCFQPGSIKATFGSGTSVLLNIGPQFQLADSDTMTAIAWVFQGQPTYAFEGLINFSAATIDWLKNQLGLIQNVTEVEPLCLSVPDNGGVYLVPAFAGLGAPYWNSSARAALIGMSAHTNRAHVVRAAVESIAFQTDDAISNMHHNASVAPTSILADGGASANPFVMQTVANISQLRVEVSPIPELSALGAAWMGFWGMQEINSLDQITKTPRELIAYHPQFSIAQVQQLRNGWSAAVRRVL